MTEADERPPRLDFIRRLYPDLNDEELREAEQTFWDYVATARHIFERAQRHRRSRDANQHKSESTK